MRASSRRPPARDVESLVHVLQSTDGDDSRAVDAGRVAAARALGELADPAAAPALIQALRHPNQVSVAAALALGRLRSAAAVEPLIAMLEDPHKFWMPRAAAAVALGHMGAQAAIPALTRALAYDAVGAGTSWDVLAHEAVEDALRHLQGVSSDGTLEAQGKRYALWGFG